MSRQPIAPTAVGRRSDRRMKTRYCIPPQYDPHPDRQPLIGLVGRLNAELAATSIADLDLPPTLSQLNARRLQAVVADWYQQHNECCGGRR